MRFLLNGQFTINGEKYWRVDDIDRMAQEEKDGTFNLIRNMQRFGIAISCHNMTHEQVTKIVELINKGVSSNG